MSASIEPLIRPSSNSLPLLPAQRVGDYVIERALESNDAGTTYVASDSRTGEQVAIKEFFPVRWVSRNQDGLVVAQGPEYGAEFARALQRFITEGRVLCELRHPNLVKGKALIEDRGTAFLVMEFVNGQRLSEAVRLMRLAGETQLRQLAEALAGALEAVHNCGVVHGGVHPEHILVRTDDSSVLLDLALARRIAVSKQDGETTRLPTHYMPVEQVDEGEIGPWTDVYSLGATLYRAVAGEPPVNAMTRLTMREAGSPDPLIPATKVCDGLYSRRFLRAIDAALLLDAAKRPQSIEAWRQCVEQGAVAEEEELPESDLASDLGPVEPRMAGTEVDEVFLDAFRARLRSGSPEHLTRSIRARTRVRRSRLSSTTVVLSVAVVAGGLYAWHSGAMDPYLSQYLPAQPTAAAVQASATAATSDPSPTISTEAVPTTVARAESSEIVTSAVTPTETSMRGNDAPGSTPVVEATTQPVETSLAATSSVEETPLRPAFADTSPRRESEQTTVQDAQLAALTAEQQREVASLLKAAKADVARLRLTSPPGRNAFERFNQALEIDPGNADATAGLQSIVGRYIKLAEREAGRGNVAKVRSFLDRAGTVLPDAALLAEARNRLLPKG